MVKDAPSTPTIQRRDATLDPRLACACKIKTNLIRTTNIDMPDTLTDIVRSWSGSSFCSISADDLIPLHYVIHVLLAWPCWPTLCISNIQTALEKRLAATRYKKHVERIEKIWREALFPPLRENQPFYNDLLFIVLNYLHIIRPTVEPARTPVITGKGKADAG